MFAVFAFTRRVSKGIPAGYREFSLSKIPQAILCPLIKTVSTSCTALHYLRLRCRQ